MFDIGFSELLLLGAVALIVIGPEKLPIAARTAGRWYAQLRRMITNVQRDIEQELQLAEMRDQMQKELSRIKEMEQSMQQRLDEMHDNLAELNPAHKSANIDKALSNNTTILSQSSTQIYLPIQPEISIFQQQPWQLNRRKKLMIEMQNAAMIQSSKIFEPVPAS